MRLTVPIKLRWSDFDAYQHVNNAELLRILEEARIEAFWTRDDGSSAGTAILDGRPGADSMTLIARQEVEYLAPIPYSRAPLAIELWIGHLGGASLKLCYEIFSPDGVEPRVLFAKAATTLVMVDSTTGKPRRIDDAQRAAWEPYIEAPIEFSRR
ncbi:thioesterase family protein [Herbiconiux sp. L3-i23]|uniref:acyl-CoA thioesterase n=1 Tax=Herbiconiux sp. L3-i23 TaxID=2905871 RepID=UPI00205754A3|nr:thioesterase family protein [Herbiconiux sp. L3-i23]BDI23231.1 thioesterase [Herbiconiux sp. L3-i23]